MKENLKYASSTRPSSVLFHEHARTFPCDIQLRVHFVVFVSLVFWGFVWGPVGMLISVPLTVVCKLFLEQNDQTRWLAILLGPGSEVREAVSRRVTPVEPPGVD